MSEGRGELDPVLSALPAIPAGTEIGFLKAVSFLFGGAGSYISTWIRRASQPVEDKTDARSLITKAVAEAAAKEASSDPEIVRAAIEAYLPKELRRAENKARVVQAAATTLIEQPESKASSDEIDEDWLNMFERSCEDASSEQMQRMWGRVLAGEITEPGRFAKSTVRLISELDKQTAECFEEYCSNSVQGVLFHVDEIVFPVDKLIQLESAGLITGASGAFGWVAPVLNGNQVAILGRKLALLGVLETGGGFSITASQFTKAGSEISTLILPTDEEAVLLKISKYLETMKPGLVRKDRLLGLSLCEITNTTETSYSLNELRRMFGVDPFRDSMTAEPEPETWSGKLLPPAGAQPNPHLGTAVGPFR